MSQPADPESPVAYLADLGISTVDFGRDNLSLLPTGPFHVGRAWRWTSLTTGDSFLVKERPDGSQNREHAMLAWRLATHPYWKSCAWLPALAHPEKPWITGRGVIFQAWTWMRGDVPEPLTFKLPFGLDRLEQFSDLTRRILGEREGAYPCVDSRRNALLKWLENAPTCAGALENRCHKALAECAGSAMALLGSIRLSGKLRACHGDPWIGNWIQMNTDSGTPEYSIIDWSTVRWDHPASDRARLIGSAGEPETATPGDGWESDRTLAWTGHVAALCNWMAKRKGGPWGPEARNRVEWLLFRLGR